MVSSAGDEIVLVNSAIPRADMELLRQCAGTVTTRGVVEVSPFARYGRSGARLYLLRIQDTPLVVKIDSAQEIDAENGRRKNLRGVGVKDSWDIDRVEGDLEGRAALILRYQGQNPDTLRELDDLYLEAQGVTGTGQRQAGSGPQRKAFTGLIDVLTDVYDEKEILGNSHEAADGGHGRTFEHYYRRYTTRDSHPDRIDQMFSSGDGDLQVYGEYIANPLKSIPTVFALTPDLAPVRAVHGDLHLSNVVIGNVRPHVVDFAWSECDDHVVKDYVTMESSLRFMRFPRHVPPEAIQRVDAHMNGSLDIASLAEAMRTEPDQGLRWCAYVMVEAVSTVRSMLLKRVKDRRLGGDPTRDYFRALYLVLCGQQRFDTFPAHRVAWNLHDLERRYVDA